MRIFKLILGALAMVFTALLFMGITFRIALHGGEVSVPAFSGMSLQEASDAALSRHLDLRIDNKFYSTTVPAGRIIAQSPAAGATVRKKWPVRVTVSLGPQQVSIPDVVGQPQREAAMNLRRNQLDLGAMAHIGAPGDPDIVLAQTPPPNAGVDRPVVSLLLSQSADAATDSFVLPSFTGLTYGAANRAAAALGLRLTYIADTPPAPAAPAPAAPIPGLGEQGAPAAAAEPVRPATPAGPVTAQKPEAGHRANKGDVLRVTFGHPASANQ